MSGHSPGPWKWCDVFDEYECTMPYLVDSAGTRVCDFGTDEQYYPTAGSPPGPADAALIAAAPEMLAELRNYRSIMDEEFPEAIARVDALIARAEGHGSTSTSADTDADALR